MSELFRISEFGIENPPKNQLTRSEINQYGKLFLEHLKIHACLLKFSRGESRNCFEFKNYFLINQKISKNFTNTLSLKVYGNWHLFGVKGYSRSATLWQLLADSVLLEDDYQVLCERKRESQ